MQMQGKTVFITGAARGIGAATAERLHAAGANVALVGLEPELLRENAARMGERVLWHEADTTDVTALEEAVARTVEQFGAVDVAIANAGVHWTGAFGTSPLARIEREIEIDLLGVVRTAHAVLPQILASKGYLLNIASLAAASHAPLMTAYAASKAGVEAFSDSLRIELAGTGARVGCAYFGVIETDMVRAAYALPAIQRAQKEMPGFVRNSVPVSKAVDAIENGVRKRKARVWAPRYVGPALAFRGILQPLLEARAMRSKAVRESIEISRADVPAPGSTPQAEQRPEREADPVA
jgi:NAD(P)-dependent dehydrogenase (short-subunit alcohol dehydrogenase family)